ncbi:MAG: 4a-hydroxytetrahydrobiopterin dehydratase [Alphaproteobacteria bacterium GM7ARS4]|nr:4a-hydroxytetrahydrobiopterin dehydratase [Alphaproteobacteria bacterium GM7ARS4]
MKKEKVKVYSVDEIQRYISEHLPHWVYKDGWLVRHYRTYNWKSTLMVINTVGHMAEAAWHHPDLKASYGWVDVRLMTHTEKGITDKDFSLARRIESVVCWRPSEEDVGLTGTPQGDLRFSYVKYDEE